MYVVLITYVNLFIIFLYKNNYFNKKNNENPQAIYLIFFKERTYLGIKIS